MLLIIMALALTGFSAFGQGYFLFTANKNSVWDNRIAAPGGGHTIAAFLWGPADTVGLLGTVGSPTNAFFPFLAWDHILIDPQFHFATNVTSGALVTQPVNATGLQIGGIGYLAGASFTVAGTSPGAVYTIYCIAWDSTYATPLNAAAAGSPAIGWSNPFQYASGATAASPVVGFSTSGMQPFGVGIPEPTAVALGGLGVATLLFRRRMPSKSWNRSRPFVS
jgi:hypothetical protein